MEIELKVKIDWEEVKIVFIRKSKMKFYRKNKYFPIHTQCLIFKNGLLENFSEIIKHEKDLDNINESLRISLNKALDKIPFPWYKKDVLDEFENKIESLTQKQD